MNFTMKKWTALLLAFVLCLSPFSLAQASDNNYSNDSLENTIIDMAISDIMRMYKFDVNTADLYRNALREVIKAHPELMETALQGAFNHLDPYSRYYTSDEFSAFLENMSGEFCGIGVTIMEFEDGLQITTVHRNSPAEAAGLETGDIIFSVDGISIAGMDINTAKSYIVGEEGSTVNIGVRRGQQEIYMDVQRAKVVIDKGFTQVLENGAVGYIKLYDFDEHADEFVISALNNFDEQNIDTLIFDLRDNPGGSVQILINILSYLIPPGPVIHFAYKDPENISTYVTNDVTDRKDWDIVVLVNENTASAAEAFSGAIQDNGTGIVVGTQTYGKGTMQTVTKIITGGGIKLTEAEYLTPKKRNINGIGIEPDVKVTDRQVPFSEIYYEMPAFDRVLQTGDTGKDVLAMEQRLDALGYSIGIPDEVFGEDTFYAVKKFQEQAGLFPYGVLDITTQLSIANKVQNIQITLDDTLQKALDIIRENAIDSYKVDWDSLEKQETATAEPAKNNTPDNVENQKK